MGRIRTQQPEFIVPINWSHPFSKGLTCLTHIGPGHVLNLVGLDFATIVTSTLGVNEHGRLINNVNTTDIVTIASDSSTILPTGPITIISGYEKTDATLRNSGPWGVDTATAGERCSCHLPWGSGSVFWDYGGTGAGNRLTVASLSFGDDVWAFTVGARGMELWQNGVVVGSNGDNPTRSATTDPFGLGKTVANSDQANYYFFMVYHGQLPEKQIISLSQNPWQVLQPHSDVSYLPIAAAGGVPLRIHRSMDGGMNQVSGGMQ